MLRGGIALRRSRGIGCLSRRGECGLGFSGRVLLGDACYVVLELAHPAPERPDQFGNSLDPEEQQDDVRFDDEMPWGEFIHRPHIGMHRLART